MRRSEQCVARWWWAPWARAWSDPWARSWSFHVPSTHHGTDNDPGGAPAPDASPTNRPERADPRSSRPISPAVPASSPNLSLRLCVGGTWNGLAARQEPLGQLHRTRSRLSVLPMALRGPLGPSLGPASTRSDGSNGRSGMTSTGRMQMRLASAYRVDDQRRAADERRTKQPPTAPPSAMTDPGPTRPAPLRLLRRLRGVA
jgi:hypothetical protein